ncbi:hypothetical protein G5V59_02505 [Nocardioides sp. W3-2-3]|uniref:hypothetical protein n=1 Tax=Nocardioides convexus TaxID=2712224 RepID=UPI002418247B|nr:hypothetical protein [Nocardioides convexus]NGZ99624.1 hypothetical protein [Nocardioides convexus]
MSKIRRLVLFLAAADALGTLPGTGGPVTVYRGEIPDPTKVPLLQNPGGYPDRSGRIAPYVVLFGGTGNPFVEPDVADTADEPGLDAARPLRGRARRGLPPPRRPRPHAPLPRPTGARRRRRRPARPAARVRPRPTPAHRHRAAGPVRGPSAVPDSSPPPTEQQPTLSRRPPSARRAIRAAGADTTTDRPPAPEEAVMTDGFVEVYAKSTGAKQSVPEHWLSHPVLGRDFSKTPLTKAIEARAAGAESPSGEPSDAWTREQTRPARRRAQRRQHRPAEQGRGARRDHGGHRGRRSGRPRGRPHRPGHHRGVRPDPGRRGELGVTRCPVRSPTATRRSPSSPPSRTTRPSPPSRSLNAGIDAACAILASGWTFGPNDSESFSEPAVCEEPRRRGLRSLQRPVLGHRVPLLRQRDPRPG